MKVHSMLALCETDTVNPVNLQVGTLVQLTAKVSHLPTKIGKPASECIVLLDGEPIFIGLPVQRNGQRAVKITDRLSKNKIGELSKANVSICIGTAELSVQAVLDKEKEAFIELDGAPNDPGELYVNGDLVARGEVVTVGSDFGMRIAEVIS